MTRAATISVRVRVADAGDEAFLWEMLTHAASMPSSDDAAIASAQSNPDLFGYVREWGREGDLGVIAERVAPGAANDGERLGAAWLRAGHPGLHDHDERRDPLPPPAEGEAELAIAMRPAARGQGIGTRLLEALTVEARGRYRAIVLSVRAENPAVRVYERAGFRVEREITNRVGTRSYAMRLELD